MTGAEAPERWRDDERVLAAIGAALFDQDTTCRVRIPSELARQAVAAWRREDEVDDDVAEDPALHAVRERAAALALLGAQLDAAGPAAGPDLEVALDAWYLGVALGAADDFDLIGPDRERPTAVVTRDAHEPLGFSLWLEFEHVPQAVEGFCNVGVTCSDGTAYALNVWTFDFVQALATGTVADAGGELAAGYSRPPDLLVHELSRAGITMAVAHLLAHGGLPAHRRLPDSTDQGSSAADRDPGGG